MSVKWTEERRQRFKATMKKRAQARHRVDGAADHGLPVKLQKALLEHYRKVVIQELLRSYPKA